VGQVHRAQDREADVGDRGNRRGDPPLARRAHPRDRRSGRSSPALQLLHAARHAGVDLRDEESLDAFIATWNTTADER